MNKKQVKELAEINATYTFDRATKQYGEFTDEYVRHFYNKLAELRGEIDDVHTCNCKHNSNSRDNEPCCMCDSITASINKAKVDSLEIIARMLDDKPYYELKYRIVGKKDYSIGYSSYDLKSVLSDIDTYFEIVESDKHTNADRIRSMTDEELAEYLPVVADFICKPTKNCIRNTLCNRGECERTKECATKWLKAESEDV